MGNTNNTKSSKPRHVISSIAFGAIVVVVLAWLEVTHPVHVLAYDVSAYACCILMAVATIDMARNALRPCEDSIPSGTSHAGNDAPTTDGR